MGVVQSVWLPTLAIKKKALCTALALPELAFSLVRLEAFPGDMGKQRCDQGTLHLPVQRSLIDSPHPLHCRPSSRPKSTTTCTTTIPPFGWRCSLPTRSWQSGTKGALLCTVDAPHRHMVGGVCNHPETCADRTWLARWHWHLPPWPPWVGCQTPEQQGLRRVPVPQTCPSTLPPHTPNFSGLKT